MQFVLATGLPSIDTATAVGGIPFGRIVEIFGPESVGKTTLMKFLAGLGQALGAVTYYLDWEDTIGLDPAFDAALGLDPSRLLLTKPPNARDAALRQNTIITLEDVFGAIETMCQALQAQAGRARRGGAIPALIFLDSIAACRTQAEVDTPLDDTLRPAARATVMSRALPRLLPLLAGTATSVIFVNQVRDNIGARPFQPQDYSPGGRAFKHYTHLRLRLTRIGWIREGSPPVNVGIRTKLRVEKSKVGVPLREGAFALRFSGALTDDPGALTRTFT